MDSVELHTEESRSWMSLFQSTSVFCRTVLTCNVIQQSYSVVVPIVFFSVAGCQSGLVAGGKYVTSAEGGGRGRFGEC